MIKKSPQNTIAADDMITRLVDSDCTKILLKELCKICNF